MADLQALADQMRLWAKSCKDIGDSYDEEGNSDQAQYHWGKAQGYAEAAEMADREIAREARDAEPDDDHDPDCDGTYIARDAGFGGQDITYECQHPSHREARDV